MVYTYHQNKFTIRIDDKIVLCRGKLTLLSEITFDKVDKEKLFTILKGLCLYQDFHDIESLKNSSSATISNGMEQRILLARLLYNLGDSDIVAID